MDILQLHILPYIATSVPQLEAGGKGRGRSGSHMDAASSFPTLVQLPIVQKLCLRHSSGEAKGSTGNGAAGRCPVLAQILTV